MDPRFEPLKNAAYSGDFELFKKLLEDQPALVNSSSADPGDSPNVIQFVVVEGGLGKIPEPVKYLEFLIEKGSTTERQLVAAASVGSRELIDVLLDAGVPLTDGAPWTAVEESLYWGHTEIADYLVNYRGAEVRTLCASAMMEDLEKLETFFVEGKLVASVLPMYFPWGPFEESTTQDVIDQAFFLALRSEKYKAAAFLYERGADMNAIVVGHHEQCTVLHQAANRGDREMSDWLLDRGATNGVKDPRFGADAIGWAKHAGHNDLAAHLELRSKNSQR